VRRYEFLAPVTVSLLMQRRTTAPFGLKGGEAAAPGKNFVERRDRSREPLPGSVTRRFEAGEKLRIETPGGGGYGPRS
jgi:N-methylhydantoinase B